MSLNPLSFLADIFGKTADKIAPDKGKVLEAQARINEQEIASSGGGVPFLRSWRGGVGWILCLLLAWEVIGRPIMTCYFPDVPIPPSQIEYVGRILFGMMGLGI